MFKAFFVFLAERKLEQVLPQKYLHRPNFRAAKRGKCFKPAENPTETIDTQARGFAFSFLEGFY